MLPYSSKYRLRLVTMNMRDYRGSTSYTEEDLAHFVNSDLSVQENAVRTFGQDVVLFLAYVCKNLSILGITVEDGDKFGGLVVMAWSLGCLALCSILGDPQTLDDETKSILGPILRKVIFYGRISLSFRLLVAHTISLQILLLWYLEYSQTSAYIFIPHATR
jgi:hypothetical protein